MVGGPIVSAPSSASTLGSRRTTVPSGPMPEKRSDWLICGAAEAPEPWEPAAGRDGSTAGASTRPDEGSSSGEVILCAESVELKRVTKGATPEASKRSVRRRTSDNAFTSS